MYRSEERDLMLYYTTNHRRPKPVSVFRKKINAYITYHVIVEFLEELRVRLQQFDNGLRMGIRIKSFLKGHSRVIDRRRIVVGRSTTEETGEI